jgi:hypothetical protein
MEETDTELEAEVVELELELLVDEAIDDEIELPVEGRADPAYVSICLDSRAISIRAIAVWQTPWASLGPQA